MAQQDRVSGREASGPITAERLDVVAWDPREMTVDPTQQVRGGLEIRLAKRFMVGR